MAQKELIRRGMVRKVQERGVLVEEAPIDKDGGEAAVNAELAAKFRLEREHGSALRTGARFLRL